MDRILLGDNQFFAVSHVSDARSMAQSIAFKDDRAILSVLGIAMDEGISTFMCTTHDRIGTICEMAKSESDRFSNLKIFPCMPYAHKYANAVTELGMAGAVKQFIPGNIFGSLFKGGMAFLSNDFESMMELMIDSEMKMLKGMATPIIFLQNVVTDLLLGLGAVDILLTFHKYVEKKYNAEAGFITMNMPKLVSLLESKSVINPIVCTSINKAGFRMSGGQKLYEHTLKTKKVRAIAMQVLGGGVIPVNEAIEYVCALPNISSILFGASSRTNIANTVAVINKYDSEGKSGL